MLNCHNLGHNNEMEVGADTFSSKEAYAAVTLLCSKHTHARARKIGERKRERASESTQTHLPNSGLSVTATQL